MFPELLYNRAENGLGRQEAGSPQRTFHSGLGDVSDVESVVVREQGREAQAFLVHLIVFNSMVGYYRRTSMFFSRYDDMTH